MKLITETIDSVNVLHEEKDGKKHLYIQGIFLQGNQKNRNGRMYQTETLDREVQRYVKESVLKGRAYGELGHPDGPGINLDRVSHMVTELKRDGDNFVGRARISSTPMGKIVEGLISDGANLGVSSRGMGSLKEKNGIMEVQDDFYLATAADIVADPSAPDAFVNGIMEGVEYWFDPDGTLRHESIAAAARKSIDRASANGRLDEQTMFKLFERYIDQISKL